MPSSPVLVVFAGGMSGSPVEELLAEALHAAALDSIEEALATDAFAGAVLVTDSPELAAAAPAGATADIDDGTFHFGRRLADVIERHGIECPVYFGAGSVPLLKGSDFAALARHLEGTERTVISNNFFSGDLTAFRPGAAIHDVEPAQTDNALPRLLRDAAGLSSTELPRSTASQFNIDSPADLALLALRAGAGPRLQRLLESCLPDLGPYEMCLPYLTDPKAEVLVAGRVGSQVWQYLEREMACRVRVFSEERGMAAAGRDRLGRARSLVGYHLAQVGSRRFFEEVASLADCAFIDTRVLVAHAGARPSRADRFLSDLGRYQEVEDPFLRKLTEAAVQATVPVILGGHSLMSGGLMALTEAAWREYDKATEPRRPSD